MTEARYLSVPAAALYCGLTPGAVYVRIHRRTICCSSPNVTATTP